MAASVPPTARAAKLSRSLRGTEICCCRSDIIGFFAPGRRSLQSWTILRDTWGKVDDQRFGRLTGLFEAGSRHAAKHRWLSSLLRASGARTALRLEAFERIKDVSFWPTEKRRALSRSLDINGCGSWNGGPFEPWTRSPAQDTVAGICGWKRRTVRRRPVPQRLGLRVTIDASMPRLSDDLARRPLWLRSAARQ